MGEHMNRIVPKFEADSLLKNFPKISLPLPLPDVSSEWGVATLLLRFKATAVLLVLNLLLLESSVLVVGTSSEQVTSCALALLDLLKPYEWSSAFIPSIPIDYLDFVSSPVPLIAGIVAENKSRLKDILFDDRVKDALNNGTSILNLDTGNVANKNDSLNMIAYSQVVAILRAIKKG